MATDYTEFQDLAVDLLGDSGREITIQHYGPDVAADASKPWRAEVPSTSQNQKVFAVFSNFSNKEIDASNNRIMASDLKVLLPARDLKFVPTKRDLVVDGTKTYKIMDVVPLKPGPLIITYKLQAREG